MMRDGEGGGEVFRRKKDDLYGEEDESIQEKEDKEGNE